MFDERDGARHDSEDAVAAWQRGGRIPDRARGARSHRRVRRHRPRHDGRHQRAARAQGRARRPDHDARLSRRARNAPPRPAAHLGAAGAISCRSSTAICGRGRRAHAGRRSIRVRGRSSTRSSRRPRGSSLAQARRRWRSCSSTPTPIPPTSARPRRRRAPSGRTSMWSASQEILPEIREFERASTTALNAYLQPRRRQLPRIAAGRSGREGFAGEFHIVQSNGGVMSTARRAQIPRPHRAVRPGRGRDRRGRNRPRRRLRRCHHRRSRRHLVRCIVDRRRRACAGRADHHRFRAGHPHADDRDHDHRRRRRLDRPSIAAACCRSGRKRRLACRDRSATARAATGRR